MATFTMRLEDVLENVYGTTMDADDFEIQHGQFIFDGVTYGELPVLPDHGKAIGLGGYPIFDERYRDILNGKIIDEYRMREIGQETIDEWRLTLRRTMNRIMPYYNKLYESEKIEYGPLMTMSIHSVGKNTLEGLESSKGSNITDSTTKSNGRAVSSETPQTMLSGDEDYATAASDSNSTSEVDATSEQETDSTTNSEANNDNLVTGFQGIASNLVTLYRQSLLNIDDAIINSDDVQACFMLMSNNGDAYSRPGWIF